MLSFLRKREAKKKFREMLDRADEESLRQFQVAVDITQNSLPAIQGLECDTAKSEFLEIVEMSHAKYGTKQFQLYWASWNCGLAGADAKSRGDDKAWLLYELARSYLKSESLLIFGDTAIDYLNKWASGELDEDTLAIAMKFRFTENRHDWLAEFENFSMNLPQMTYEEAMEHIEGIELTSGGAFVSLTRSDMHC